MLHLYCGNGKGKTTAAMGLALRAAGRGKRVVIAQFLKGADSGERLALARLPQVTLLPVPDAVKFSFRMSEDERRSEAQRYQDLLKLISRTARGCFLLVLDEACAACRHQLVDEALLRQAAAMAKQGREVVLTGRDPAPWMQEAADYSTELRAVRHPYTQGTPAREGIEY